MVESDPQTNEDYPQELLDLELMYESNNKKLNELKEIEDRNKEEQREYNRRIKMNKQINEDIKYIKDLYGIEYLEYEKISVYNDTNALSYSEAMDSLSSITLGETDFDLEVDEIKLTKIKEIANEILTDKQYVFFDLYFFQGLKQKEISNLTGDNQSTVSRNINSIIAKIKQSLLEK